MAVRFKSLLVSLLAVTSLHLAAHLPAAAKSLPHLVPQGTTQQLIVDDQPFLIIGGELGNSTASSLDYLRPHWKLFNELNMNTVLAPVSWEMVEPVEGRFDFTILDGLLRDARAANQRLVLLWFGAWKNSMSSYVPTWVKRDQQRFPRVALPSGRGVEILTPFSTANRDADARAFAALMAHLKKVDGDQHTVIMVQVENEIGMLPLARDHSQLANAAYAGPVPDALLRQLAAHRDRLEPELRRLWEVNGARMSGTWAELFGSSTWGQEVFTAWYFAQYAEAVTAAGKAQYKLPMFVNAALNRPGREPGEYPSGGPVPHLLDIWKWGAPSIDMLSPDLYFPNFRELTSRYVRPDNVLFIPEANNAGRPETAGDAFHSFGALQAIGFSPFAIESITGAQKEQLAGLYGLLRQISPLILSARGTGRMAGFRPNILFDNTVLEAPETVVLGDYKFTVSYVDPWTPKAEQNTRAHGGIIIQTARDEFYIAGSGITVTFDTATPGPAVAGIDSAWEGRFEKGRWVPGRLMNGDQTHQGRHVRLPPNAYGVQKVTLYRYD